MLSSLISRLRLDRYVSAHFDRGIWILTGISFLNASAFSISLPFLALYLYQERGVTMTLVGVILLVSGLASAGVQMFGGAIADRIGRRPLLMAGVIGNIVLYLAMAALIAIDAPVVWIVVVFTSVRSVLMVARPAFSAIVADLAPRGRMTQAFGLLRIGMNLGWAAGPAVGGYLATFLSYAWLFAFASMIGMVSLVVVLSAVCESHAGNHERITASGVFAAARDRNLVVFTSLCLLVFMVMGQMSSTLSVFTVDRAGFTSAQYGSLLTVNGALVVLFQYPMTLVIARMPNWVSLTVGSVLYGIGYFTMGLLGGFPLAVAAMVIVTSGEIIFSPTSMAVVGELSPKDSRGRYMGFVGLAETVGMSLGPMLGGVLLDSFTSLPVAIWGVIAAFAWGAAIGFSRWRLKGDLNP